VRRSALAIACVSPLIVGAQRKPPALLDIVQERVVADSADAYARNEDEIARVCRTLHCPVHYVALESVSGENAVWWFNAYESASERDTLRRQFQQNATILAALRPFAARKKTLRLAPLTFSTTFRPAQSRPNCWRADARFYVITIDAATPVANGCRFQADDGTRIDLVSVASRDEAVRVAAADPVRSTALAVRPSWSTEPSLQSSPQ